MRKKVKNTLAILIAVIFVSGCLATDLVSAAPDNHMRKLPGNDGAVSVTEITTPDVPVTPPDVPGTPPDAPDPQPDVPVTPPDVIDDGDNSGGGGGLSPVVWLNPYTDVDETDWFYDAVRYVTLNGFVDGDSDTLFSPEDDMSRAVLATALYCIEGKPIVRGNIPFTDVAAGKWYSDAILWITQESILIGYGDGTFGVEDPLTCEQVASVLHRYAYYSGMDTGSSADLSIFTDAGDVSEWALEYVRWAVAEGIIPARSGTTIEPRKNVTRAEIAEILMRFAEVIPFRFDITDEFTDANFRAEVYRVLGKAPQARIYNTDVKRITWLNVVGRGIESLDGIEYFINLDQLYCWNNQLTTLPTLPENLTYFDCSENLIKTLHTLPSGLTTLYCHSNQLTDLPELPNGLKYLHCSNNQLTELRTLPSSLEYLHCYNNQIRKLPNLPVDLYKLDCGINQLTELPQLPNGLSDLYCDDNQLTSLPKLPYSLQLLWCYDNQLTQLPALPNGLEFLDCYNNQLTQLPALPNGLETLYCDNNQLTQLPALPNGLVYLDCSFNQLKALPVLPNGLLYLDCSFNQLSGLDISNSTSLYVLYCDSNCMASPDDVIGWREIGLILYEPDAWNANFYFYPQRLIHITTQPTAKTTVIQGSITGQLSVDAITSEDGELKFQWYSNTTASNKDGTPIDGATSKVFTIPTSLTVGTYYHYCVVSVEDVGSETSDIATVTVTSTSSPPSVQPKSPDSSSSPETDAAEPVVPLAPAFPFTDVNSGDWFYSNVQYVFGSGLMNGTSTDMFSPNVSLTRGMIVTILYRHAGSPNVSDLKNPFDDVSEGKYYTEAVKWAAENEVVFGFDGKFSPDDFITRQDLAVILHRYAGFAGIELPTARVYSDFGDDTVISDYAKEAVAALFEAQIINGKPGNLFDPGGNTTRAEVAAMLHRFSEIVEE